MRNLLRMFFSWAVFASALSVFNYGSARAQTAPGFLPFQGYLADSAGQPVSGSLSITFTLYNTDKPTGATNRLYQETVPVVNVSEGYFSVYLGEKTPLDLAVFQRNPIVFVGVLVSGDTAEMKPLLQLATAPYAAFSQYAGNAATLDGKSANAFMSATPATASIPWSAVATPTPSSIPWSAVKDVPADRDTLGSLTCGNGKVAKSTGTAWVCGDAPAYSAAPGGGLTLDGENRFALDKSATLNLGLRRSVDCVDAEGGGKECSCAAGEAVISGGAQADGFQILLAESRQLNATTWRVKCANVNGTVSPCKNVGVLCARVVAPQ